MIPYFSEDVSNKMLRCSLKAVPLSIESEGIQKKYRTSRM